MGETDPDKQWFGRPFVETRDGLLHGLSTVEGAARNGEDDHKPVAKVLDLGTTVVLNGSPQKCEVCLAQLIAMFRVEARGHLG